MRNGKAKLLQIMAAACSFCLILLGAEKLVAAQLEETDSGAPSAIVMFPVSGKDTPMPGSMKPVVFNHLIHERAVSDCESCHHTGSPESCIDCHTPTGSEAGKFITLDRAMHATDIAKRPDGVVTPSSCVSCHEKLLAENKNCQGCHSIVRPARDDRWCAVCHNGEVTQEQLRKGVAGTMTSEENLEIATTAVVKRQEAPKLPTYFAPTKVVIDTLQNEYQPSLFNHRRHVNSLVERIKDNKLAEAFHYQPEVLCATCHHNSPLTMHPPKCSSCHPKTIDPAKPELPNLKAAYHLQCMGCHQGMTVYRPQNTDCSTCHKDKAGN